MEDEGHRAPAFVALHAPDGAYLYASEEAAVVLGYTAEELVGTNVFNEVHPDDVPALVVAVEHGDAFPPTSPVPVRLRHRTDGWVWVESTAQIVRDPGGAPMAITVVRRRIATGDGPDTGASSRVGTAASLDLAHDAIFVRAPDGGIRYWNSGATRLYGWGASQALGRAVQDLLQTQYPSPIEEVEAALLAHGSWEGVVQQRDRDGRVIPVAARWTLCRTADGQPAAVFELHADLAEARAVSAPDDAEPIFQELVEHAPIAMAAIAPDRRVRRINRALAALLNAEADAVIGRPADEFLHPDDRAQHAAVFSTILDDGNGRDVLDRVDLRLLRPDGTVRWVEVTKTVVRDVGGRPVYVLAQIVDIDRRKRTEEQLSRWALHDPLTGLPNRRLLFERLKTVLADRRAGSDAIAVLFVDLDGFKGINDSLGHEAGDAVLVEVAARLRTVVRPGDTVARLSGDEFVLVCTGLGDASAAAVAAQQVERRVEQSLRTPVAAGGRDVHVSASIGAAIGSRGTDSATELLSRADREMYEAKTRHAARRGRTGFVEA